MNLDRKQSWRGRRVFVTGGSGFVGSNLVHALLDRDAVVTCLVAGDECSPRWREVPPGRVQVVDGFLECFADVRHAIEATAPEVVLHLGAQALVGEASRHPRRTFEINTAGTWNLLEACRLAPRAPDAVVVASSDKAYGECRDLPCREDAPLAGRFPYDASKACADLVAQAYAATYRLPVAIARCGNIFGPGDVHWSRLVPGTIRALLHDEAPVIRSNGTPLRDWLYVDDAVGAYLALAEHVASSPRGLPLTFNFSLEQPVTVLGVVRMLGEALGRTDLTPRILDEAKSEIAAQHLDATLARARLHWSPRVDLDAAIRRTVDWYRRHLASAAPSSVAADLR